MGLDVFVVAMSRYGRGYDERRFCRWRGRSDCRLGHRVLAEGPSGCTQSNAHRRGDGDDGGQRLDEGHRGRSIRTGASPDDKTHSEHISL
jgi:hypothetical protein